MGKSAVFVLFSAIVILVSSVVSARADYYGYRDAKGVWRYTDDLNSIPPAQRKGMKVIKSEKPDVEASAAADAGKAGDEKPADASAKPGAAASKTGVADQLAILNRERDALERERLLLQAERSALESERAQTGTRKNQAEVNEKAKAYNERVKAYDARRVTYEKKVKETVSAR